MYQAPPPSPAVSSTTPSSERPTGIAAVNQIHVQNESSRNGNANRTGFAPAQNELLMPQRVGGNNFQAPYIPQGATFPQTANSSMTNSGFKFANGLMNPTGQFAVPHTPQIRISNNVNNRTNSTLSETTPTSKKLKRKAVQATRSEEKAESYLFDVESVRRETYRLFMSLENNPQALLKAKQKIIIFIIGLQIEALSEDV